MREGYRQLLATLFLLIAPLGAWSQEDPLTLPRGVQPDTSPTTMRVTPTPKGPSTVAPTSITPGSQAPSTVAPDGKPAEAPTPSMLTYVVAVGCAFIVLIAICYPSRPRT